MILIRSCVHQLLSDVSVHQRLRGTILVSGDIEEGDTLISEGVQRLRTGQAITTELAGGLSNE